MIIVDPWHWLTEDGDFLDDSKLRNRMIRVAALNEYGGPLPVMHARETLVPCTRRPKGKACKGLLVVVKRENESLHTFCPTCGSDEFLISNWQSTLWAGGPMPPVPVEVVTVN